MKISELLKQDKRRISFEVFPPKTSTSFDNVMSAAKQIAALKPAFVSITYGAGGGTSRYTLDIAKSIQDDMQVPALAHLTCVSSSRETIHERINDIKTSGISNVLALRGDLTPEMEAGGLVSRDYHHATELIKELKAADPSFCIGGACYPEVHPESPNQAEDIKHIKEKVDAGCEFLTTQMFFDNNLFYNFLYKIREAGITVPIIPGIMPITRANQVERAIKLSGSFMPQRFNAVIDLYANGIKLVHIYSMNKPDVAEKITDNLSNIINK